MLKELKSIGRNLNQLVTLAHMGRITVINLDGVRQAFSELCAAVRLILERKAVVRNGNHQLHQLQAGTRPPDAWEP